MGLPGTLAGRVLNSQFHLLLIQRNVAIFLYKETGRACCPWFSFLLYHRSGHHFNLWRLGQLYLNELFILKFNFVLTFLRRKKIGDKCGRLIALWCPLFIPPCIQALGHVTVQDSNSGPSCTTRFGQWDAQKCDLNKSLRSVCTVGLVCFSPLPLLSESDQARMLEDEKCVHQTHVSLVVPATNQCRSTKSQLTLAM